MSYRQYFRTISEAGNGEDERELDPLTIRSDLMSIKERSAPPGLTKREAQAPAEPVVSIVTDGRQKQRIDI